MLSVLTEAIVTKSTSMQLILQDRKFHIVLEYVLLQLWLFKSTLAPHEFIIFQSSHLSLVSSRSLCLLEIGMVSTVIDSKEVVFDSYMLDLFGV